MIGCLRARVRKQPIIALYFESETVLKFYNLKASSVNSHPAEYMSQHVRFCCLSNLQAVKALARLRICAVWPKLSLLTCCCTKCGSRWTHRSNIWPLASLDSCVCMFKMGLDATKAVFRGLRTTQVQTSLPIRTVWSAPMLLAFLESIIFKLATVEIRIF